MQSYFLELDHREAQFGVNADPHWLPVTFSRQEFGLFFTRADRMHRRKPPFVDLPFVNHSYKIPSVGLSAILLTAVRTRSPCDHLNAIPTEAPCRTSCLAPSISRLSIFSHRNEYILWLSYNRLLISRIYPLCKRRRSNLVDSIWKRSIQNLYPRHSSTYAGIITDWEQMIGKSSHRVPKPLS